MIEDGAMELIGWVLPVSFLVVSWQQWQVWCLHKDQALWHAVAAVMTVAAIIALMVAPAARLHLCDFGKDRAAGLRRTSMHPPSPPTDLTGAGVAGA